MRSLCVLFLLSCLSAAAVEDVTQTVTVTQNTKTFSVLDENFDRGDGAWRILRTFTAAQTSNDPKALRVSPQLVTPFPYNQMFLDYQATQARPLIAVQNLRFSIALGTVAIESVNPAGSRVYRYTRPAPLFVGSESIVFTYFDCGPDFDNTADDVELLRVTVLFVSPNNPPSIALSASPATATAGDPVSFPSIVSDPDGQTLSVAYDYGDGLTGTAAVHTFEAPGTYSVTATVSDGHGGSASASVLVVIVPAPVPPDVLDPAFNSPVARFSTSDVVGFSGLPLVFDASTSSDPQNNIAGFTWSFGDGSPLGNGAVISKVYASPGTYSVTLTVTDLDGFRVDLVRDLEILPQEQAATFDAEVTYTAKFNRLQAGRDSLVLFARVNIGDTVLAPASRVAVTLSGKEFAGTLSKRLQSSADGVVFKVKANLRRQTPGTIELRLNARAVVGLSDAIAAAVGPDSVEESPVPLSFEIAGKTFSLNVLTDVDVNPRTGKAIGSFE